MKERGSITEGRHTGFYSVNEESFIASKDLTTKNGRYFKEDTGEELEQIEERNYVFTLTPELKHVIKTWLESPSLKPDTLRSKLLDELDARNNELSVSRPT